MALVFLLFLYSLLRVGHSNLVTVLQTTSDLSQFSPTSGAELDNSSLFGHKQVTVCASFLTYQFTSQKYANILALRKYVWLLQTNWRLPDTDIRGCTDMNESSKLFPIWDLGVWNHACIILDSISENVKMIVNGKMVVNNIPYLSKWLVVLIFNCYLG